MEWLAQWVAIAVSLAVGVFAVIEARKARALTRTVRQSDIRVDVQWQVKELAVTFVNRGPSDAREFVCAVMGESNGTWSEEGEPVKVGSRFTVTLPLKKKEENLTIVFRWVDGIGAEHARQCRLRSSEHSLHTTDAALLMFSDPAGSEPGQLIRMRELDPSDIRAAIQEATPPRPGSGPPRTSPDIG